MARIGIILGSDSDLPQISGCFDVLEEFSVDFEIIISSAHRTPEQTKEWASSAEGRGIEVIIAAAGGAAHLPGVVASYTVLPVIGIPVETNIASGLDSLLSIVQMPAGIPVAAMPVGKASGANAALYAVSILALHDPALKKAIAAFREKNAEKIKNRNSKLNSMGYREYIKSMK